MLTRTDIEFSKYVVSVSILGLTIGRVLADYNVLTSGAMVAAKELDTCASYTTAHDLSMSSKDLPFVSGNTFQMKTNVGRAIIANK